MTTAALFLAALLAQATPPPTYAKLCSGCHGDDARGSQQGPGLAGNAGLRRRNVQSIRNIIRNGIPRAAMPAFNLPDPTLDSLAAYVVSLNAFAAEANVAGDPAAGKQFFFTRGKCAGCHMANGEGSPIGPDLSTIATELTVDQLREAIQQPDRRIAPGYGLVNAKLTSGQTIRGFARARTGFDITIQDLKGAFHPIATDRGAVITDEQHSLMPAAKPESADLQNLLAFLAKLTGVKPGVAVTARPPLPGGVDFAQLLNPPPADWLTYNGSLSGNRYSALKQINTTNAANLSLRWSFSIPLWSQFLPDTPYYRENMRYFGLETVPIVVGGIMYVTGPNQAYALDASTGSQIWSYSRPRNPGLVSDASLGTNRGVAILGDNLFMVTDNAHLIALNRITGRLVWEVVMPDEPQKYGGTLAPLIVKDMVIAGVAGGDWGIRGFLDAYNAATGERVWRHWTIPAKGDPGFETWTGTAVATGGAATWLTGSYDPEIDTLYWATGNPWPNSDDSQRAGDNLFTDSVLALDPSNGKMKWYYQFTPHDTHDWDANQPNVLVNAKFRGETRKLLLHADRNGTFYVLDRTNGKVLLSKPFIRNMGCRDHSTNWNSTAYSATTGLYYVIALEKCKSDPGQKFLRALNIETGDIAWEVPLSGPVDGKRVAGILGTAGGLLFYGDPAGNFIAADERNGKPLWRIPLNATIKTSPVTFSIDGRQYVTQAVGSTIMTFALPDGRSR